MEGGRIPAEGDCAGPAFQSLDSERFSSLSLISGICSKSGIDSERCGSPLHIRVCTCGHGARVRVCFACMRAHVCMSVCVCVYTCTRKPQDHPEGDILA